MKFQKLYSLFLGFYSLKMGELESLWISFLKIEKIRKFMECIPKKQRYSILKKRKDVCIFY